MCMFTGQTNQLYNVGRNFIAIPVCVRVCLCVCVACACVCVCVKERKVLILLQVSSCHHGTKLLWAMSLYSSQSISANSSYVTKHLANVSILHYLMCLIVFLGHISKLERDQTFPLFAKGVSISINQWKDACSLYAMRSRKWQQIIRDRLSDNNTVKSYKQQEPELLILQVTSYLTSDIRAHSSIVT